MFGRKTYNQEELDHAKAIVDRQLAAYQSLVKAVAGQKVDSTLGGLEEELFNNMVIVLDRLFVHRLRMVAGKDGNPLNEVELICDSLMNNNGIMRGNNVVKYVADHSVVRLAIGDQIRLTATQFEQLAAAFFTELERRFL